MGEEGQTAWKQANEDRTEREKDDEDEGSDDSMDV